MLKNFKKIYIKNTKKYFQVLKGSHWDILKNCSLMVHKSDQYAIDKIIEIYKSIFGNFIFQKKCKFIKIN